MKQRYDVNADTARLKENGYPWTVKIGSAFANDDGTIDINLDALPLTVLDKNGKAKVRLKLWPAKDGAAKPAAAQDDLNDEVPW